MSQRRPAVLVLADGSVFRGTAIGASGVTVGELVFNTAMTGYQEILTDPSYARQIVTLTCPHVGNTGVNAEDAESTKLHVAGLVVRDLPLLASNYRSVGDLESCLVQHQIIAIADVDTRRLTRILRTGGAQAACIMAGEVDESEAHAQASAFPGLAGMDLAKVVSVLSSYEWTEGEWQLAGGFAAVADYSWHVVAFDYGVKRNILRMLAGRGCRVTVLPAQATAAEVLALQPDGIFLSNGPGDPDACDYAIEAIQVLLRSGIPIFGICLGHQLLALASGAKTIKMKFGHHGANHPVKDVDTGRVMITSQNHGFAVDIATLPATVKVTHISLFDGSLQGIARTDVPAFGFQGHPEASPGPHDVAGLFDRFVQMMDTHRKHTQTLS